LLLDAGAGLLTLLNAVKGSAQAHHPPIQRSPFLFEPAAKFVQPALMLQIGLRLRSCRQSDKTARFPAGWRFCAALNPLKDAVTHTAFSSPNLLLSAVREDPSIRQHRQCAWRASSQVHRIVRLVDRADVTAEDWLTESVQAPARIGESDDTRQTFATKVVGTATKHPGFAITGHLVQQNETPQFDRIRCLTGKDAGENAVVAGTWEDGDTLQSIPMK
jgi:hypothetical protein